MAILAILQDEIRGIFVIGLLGGDESPPGSFFVTGYRFYWTGLFSSPPFAAPPSCLGRLFRGARALFISIAFGVLVSFSGFLLLSLFLLLDRLFGISRICRTGCCPLGRLFRSPIRQLCCSIS
ncbi:MAG: hypothetical protein KJ558_00675 [Gammaproteobacteria bacterium]|nr:hypothetical protein [Gammaproteobacteria bacterium]